MILYLISVVVSLLLIKWNNSLNGKYLNCFIMISPIWAIVISVLPFVNLVIVVGIMISIFLILIIEKNFFKYIFGKFNNNKVYQFICKLISYRRKQK